jgi:hypothetical protein
LTDHVLCPLCSLSTELYTKPSHFLLEFIQNAADNKYANDVTPTLSLTVKDKVLIFECNELGFTARDVEVRLYFIIGYLLSLTLGITPYRPSAKSGLAPKRTKRVLLVGYHTCLSEMLMLTDHAFAAQARRVSVSAQYNLMRLDYKQRWLGFKSVFRVADAVIISSREYTFELDKNKELGMITPRWTDEYPVRPGWTTFHLRLSPLQDSTTIISYIKDIRPSLLLFLRQLRHMTINIQLSNTQNQLIELSRIDDDSDVVVLMDSRSNPAHYLMVKHMVKTFARESKREGIRQSEIVLAFPITATGAPIVEKQAVHAFLPLKSFGFKVSIFDLTMGLFLTRVAVHHPGRFLDGCQQRGHPLRPAVEYNLAYGHCGRISSSR